MDVLDPNTRDYLIKIFFLMSGKKKKAYSCWELRWWVNSSLNHLVEKSLTNVLRELLTVCNNFWFSAADYKISCILWNSSKCFFCTLRSICELPGMLPEIKGAVTLLFSAAVDACGCELAEVLCDLLLHWLLLPKVQLLQLCSVC